MPIPVPAAAFRLQYQTPGLEVGNCLQACVASLRPAMIVVEFDNGIDGDGGFYAHALDGDMIIASSDWAETAAFALDDLFEAVPPTDAERAAAEREAASIDTSDWDFMLACIRADR